MSYRLVTDVCCDLPQHYADAHELLVLPMTVTFEGRDYSITSDPTAPGALDRKMFYQKLRQGVPATTTQITSPVFIEAFEPILRAGGDVLYIALSSALSGTCDSAGVAARELGEKYPDRRVIVIDSRCASLGQGLLVHLCVIARESGMDLDALAAFAEANKQRIHHWVTVDDLAYIRRGGRISGPMAMLGTLLSIKPIIYVDEAGGLSAVDKVQGRKRALKYLIDRMEAEAQKPITSPVFLSHVDAAEDAQAVCEQIRSRFDVEVMIVNQISPIVGSHIGPGTMALFYVSDEARLHARSS